MDTYDFIIAGGGAAGLSLAYRMIDSPLRERSILIVDQDDKRRNDHTWCFWTDRPTLFDPVVSRSWDRFRFTGEGFDQVLSMAPFRYKMVRGIDFYNYTLTALRACPFVTFVQARVDRIVDGPDFATVMAGGQEFRGRWVFDSTFTPADFQPDPRRYHDLKQHFLGWEIETPQPAFDPAVMTLFDFNTPQKSSMRFIYTLPYAPGRALVEYTLFSAGLLQPREYEEALKDYIENTLGIREYAVREVETGVIPMTDMPFPRRAGRRVLNIGTKGGRVKPSTGYSFLRSQADTAAIVRSLLAAGHPFDLPKDPWLFHYLDTIMLQLMYRRGGQMKQIFTDLFKNNPTPRLLRFLDESASLPEVLRVLASVPPRPFLQAWFRLKVLGKV